jgi:tetratricopeptide (TPR) repeat protein
VLRQVAAALTACAGEDGVALRFGGDEFMIILRGESGSRITEKAQKLVDDVAALAFSAGLKVSVSAGVALRNESDAVLEQLLERADRALYAAKEAGRGRISVASDSAGESRQELVFSHLIGRRQELKKLRQLLEESSSYGARAAVVSGEAGVGKSRLTEEVERYCRLRGSAIMRGRCAEFYETAPYSLLVSPLRRELAGLDPAAAAEIAKDVEPLHPATLELLPELPAASRDDIQYFREERLRFRILEDLSKILVALASRKHLALILEDLQWVTKPDLELLCFAVRSASEYPVLFLFTLRSGAGDSVEILQGLLSLRSSVPMLHLPLKNLDESEARNFVLFALHDPNVPSELQQLLFRQSGGNPLFLKEFLISLEQSGCITPTEEHGRTYRLPPRILVPDSLAGVLETKLSRLSQEDLEKLRIASLTSGDFPADLISFATDRSEYDVALFIDRALRTGIISESTAGPGETRYSFAHDAYRSYLSSSVPGILRKALHKRMGGYFERLCEAGATENVTAAAYHFVAGNDEARAARYSELAAGQAFRGRAYREALRWYEAFLSSTSHRQIERGRLMAAFRNLGEVYSLTGEIEKAAQSLTNALAMATEEEMPDILMLSGTNSQRASRYAEAREAFERVIDLTPDIDLRVETMVNLAFLDYLAGDYENGLLRLAEGEALLSGVPADDRLDRVRALLLTRRADITTVVSPGTASLAIYEEARELYRSHGDRMGESRVLNNMSDAIAQTGDYERTLSVLFEVLEVDEKFDNALGKAIACYNVADCYGKMNNIAQARLYFDRYMEESGRISNELGEGYGRMGLGNLAAQDGDFEAAEREFRAAALVFSRLGSKGLESEASMRRVEALARLGRMDDASSELSAVDEAALGPREKSFLLYAKGVVELARGHFQPAADLLQRSLECPAVTPEREIAARCLALADARAGAGDAAGARTALAEGREDLRRRLSAIPSIAVRNAIASMPVVASVLSPQARSAEA